MPEQNVDLHRRLVEAFDTRDVEAYIACCDPQIELHSEKTSPGGAVYHGHDGLRKWLGHLEDAWGDELRIEPEVYFDFGEQTLTFNVLRGRGRQSGADVSMPLAQVCGWRDGLNIYLKVYLSREDALRDLGASEDGLEAITP
jgi:uncharacterized protein